MNSWFRCVALLAFLTAGAGCDDEPTSRAATQTSTPASKPEPKPAENTADTVLDGGLPDDPLLRAVYTRAAEHAPKMIPAMDLFVGTLAEGQSQEHLAVLTGGRCFKIIGAAGDGVDFLELTLLDPNQVPAQHVLGDDRAPVLGVQEPICTRQTGSYQVRVRAHGGDGRYAVGVFRSKF